MDSFCEMMESARRKSPKDEEVDVSAFADDVKLRARTAAGLQGGLEICSRWADQEDMSWSPPKCHVLEPEDRDISQSANQYLIGGEEIHVTDSAGYLGVTLRGTKIDLDKNLDRINSAMQRIGMLKAAGIHRKYITSARLVEICRTHVYPLAEYAIHLMPIDAFGKCPVSKKLELLDYRVVEYALGCINKDPVQRPNRRIGGRLPRHLKLAKLPDWLQRIRMRLRSLSNRLEKRARCERQDALAQCDLTDFRTLRMCHKSPRNMTKKDVHNAWTGLCRRLRRPIPVPDSGLLPILYEKESMVRDAGIRWFCGSFPGNPDRLQTHLGHTLYNSHKLKVANGLLSKKWTSHTRSETVNSLMALVSALECLPDRGKKRKAEVPSTSDKGKKRRKQ